MGRTVEARRARARRRALLHQVRALSLSVDQDRDLHKSLSPSRRGCVRARRDTVLGPYRTWEQDKRIRSSQVRSMTLTQREKPCRRLVPTVERTDPSDHEDQER